MHDMDRVYMELETEGNEFTSEWNEAEAEIFSEEEVHELAAELLSVSSEEELDHFLGSLVKKAAAAVGKFVRSPLGKQLGGILKGVVKKGLPIVGGALGNLVAPGVGGIIGSKLAGAAGSAFGLELEGMPQDEQHFEIAKQIVRLAADTAKTAASAPPAANPTTVAQQSLAQAARKFAPGLLSVVHGGAKGGRTGRWVRQGNRITLFGI